MPRAFVREILTARKSGEQHMLHHAPAGFKAPSKTGRFETAILCGPCDGRLGVFEEQAAKVLHQLRQRRLGAKVRGKWKIPERTVPFRVPPDDAFVRFACGVLWKYAATAPTDPSHLDLGPLLGTLQDVCFGGADIPASVDCFIERDLLQVVAFNDPTDVYYYRTPSMGPRGTARVAQMAWFNVGGFTVYVRLDDHPSDMAPARCWMAGRTQAQFVVSPRSIEQNIEAVASMREVQGDLARLNPGLGAVPNNGHRHPGLANGVRKRRTSRKSDKIGG